MKKLKIGSSSGPDGLSNTQARLECGYRAFLDEAAREALGDILSDIPDSHRNMTIGTYFHSLAGYYHTNGGVPIKGEFEWEGPANLLPGAVPDSWLEEAVRCFDQYTVTFNPLSLGKPLDNELLLVEETGIVTGVNGRRFTGAIDLVTHVDEDSLETVAESIFGPSKQLMLDTGPGIYLFDWKWHQKRSGSEVQTSLSSYQAIGYSHAYAHLTEVKPSGFIFLHIYGHKVPTVEPILVHPPDEDSISAFQYLFKLEAARKALGILDLPNPTACIGKFNRVCPHMGTRCKRFVTLPSEGTHTSNG